MKWKLSSTPSKSEPPRKYRRMDRRCPAPNCGGQCMVVGLIVSGSEKRCWHCDKCGTYWKRLDVQNMEKIYVT